MSGNLALLQRASKVFQEIAEFYVSDHPKAIKARRTVERKSRHEGGASYFHAALLSRLVALNDILDKILQRPSKGLHPSINQVARDTLQLFEDLAQDLSDDDIEGLEAYAGLRNLVRLHDLEDEHQRSADILGGFRMCLYCPSSRNQALLKIQLVRCASTLTSCTSDPAVTTNLDPESVWSETKNIDEWTPPVDITRNAQHLHGLLLPWLRSCTCGLPHEQTRISIMGAQQKGILAQHYDFCFLEEPRSASSWRTLRLQSEIDGKSARVRFESPEPDQNTVRSSVPTSWQHHHSFCEMTNNSRDVTDLIVGENELRTGRSSAPVQQVSTSSLRACLASNPENLRRSSNRIGNKRAIVLALVLSYAYLYLSDTEWWPNTSVSPDFWFNVGASGELVVHRPFLNIDIADATCKKGSVIGGLINPQRPSLPAFGKLLLEIWAGRSFDWTGLDDALKECGEDCLGPYWLCAVQACLGDDSTLKDPGSVREAGAVRDMFVRKVIKSLQWLSEKLCQQSTDQIFASTSESSGQRAPNRLDRGSRIDSLKAFRRVGDSSSQPTARVSGLPMRERDPVSDGPKRLINVHTLRLEEFASYDGWPQYAILSHRWSAAEVLFAELQQERSSSKIDGKVGWSKIVGACRQAKADGLSHIWVDSCCINKASDSELSEALNSMFRWYRDAKICYAYLADVPEVAMPQDSDQSKLRQFRSMSQSDWFQRGWTLQELLAPRTLRFFSADWSPIGDLKEISEMISRITKIDPAVLMGTRAIEDCSVAQRFSWAAHRKTTRPEDEAHCLLGLFEISLDARYGIGRLAFDELQRKILESGKGDDSLFAWDSARQPRHRSFFADSPADFKDCGDVVALRPREVRMHISCRSDGVGGRLSVYRCNKEIGGWSGPAAVLNCHRVREHWNLFAIRLQTVTHPRSKDKHNDYRVAFGATVDKRKGAETVRWSRLVSVPRSSVVGIRAREATIVIRGM